MCTIYYSYSLLNGVKQGGALSAKHFLNIHICIL